MSEENFDVYDDEGKTIDYLEEDTEIPTQRYGIVSFISPEKVIKDWFNRSKPVHQLSDEDIDELTTFFK